MSSERRSGALERMIDFFGPTRVVVDVLDVEEAEVADWAAGRVWVSTMTFAVRGRAQWVATGPSRRSPRHQGSLQAKSERSQVSRVAFL